MLIGQKELVKKSSLSLVRGPVMLCMEQGLLRVG